MLLSILIPSLPQRLSKLGELLAVLEVQADPRMEVLVLMDNKTRTLGEKRNALMQMAHGKYFAHIDDDELLSPDYFAQVREACEGDYDVIGYDATASLNGAPPFYITTSLNGPNEQPRHRLDGGYFDIRRTFWHWNLWRRELALECKFPEWYDGAEDAYFLRQALPRVKTWRKIDAALFHHRYDAKTSCFPA